MLRSSAIYLVVVIHLRPYAQRLFCDALCTDNVHYFRAERTPQWGCYTDGKPDTEQVLLSYYTIIPGEIHLATSYLQIFMRSCAIILAPRELLKMSPDNLLCENWLIIFLIAGNYLSQGNADHVGTRVRFQKFKLHIRTMHTRTNSRYRNPG